MRLIHITTFCNTLFLTKTSCFALDLYTFSNSKDNLFQGKTTCFGIMKAYEGKHFAFIRAIY